MGVETEPDMAAAADAWDGAIDERAHAAWRVWLAALAKDGDAALAAAVTYESLPADARDAWLDALDSDAQRVGVPRMALYAPLLAVETDGPRRARISAAIAEDPARHAGSSRPVRALRGVGADGTHACVVVAPLYLEFVQVLRCLYTPSTGFSRISLEPMRAVVEVAAERSCWSVAVEPTPLQVVVEELAHAILAHRRGHGRPPPDLAPFAYLFAPQLESEAEALLEWP